MKTLGKALRDYLSRKAVAGGYSWDIDRIAGHTEALTYALIAVPPLTYLLTKSLTLTLMLALTPIIPVILVMAWATYSVDIVKTNVEWELPFFLVLLDIIHDIGGNITQAFEVSGRVGLRWMRREWSIISRYALTTNSITKAMQLRARVHPSLEFQRFINGYVSVWGYSGDVSAYVKDVESSYLATLSNRLTALSKQIIDVVLAVVSAIVIMTLFIIVATVLGMGNAILYVVPAVALMIPAIILRVYQSIPYVIRIDISHDKGIYVITGLSALLAVLLILRLGVYGVPFLALPPLVFSMLVTDRVNSIRNSILSLPDLMRDVSEMVKAGVGIGAALERVVENPYPRPLVDYLRKITQFGDVRVDGPWVIRYGIGILKEISSLGSPSRALDKLVKVLLDIKTLLVGISDNARSLQILNYSLPPIFAGIVYIGRFIISMLNSIISNAPYALVGLVIPSINAFLLPLLLTAFVISLSVSLLTSLVSDLTVNPTIKFILPVPLTLALMVIAVGLLPLA